MLGGVVFLEEESAKIVLSDIVRRMALPLTIMFIPHDGRSDLLTSFPRKIAAWSHPSDVRFLIVQDNDGGNCSLRKARLGELIPPSKRERCKIRIVMQELESWYIGDPDALRDAGVVDERGYRNLSHPRLSNPDSLIDPKTLFRQNSTVLGQLAVAEAVAPHLRLSGNRSQSFKQLTHALTWLTERPR